MMLELHNVTIGQHIRALSLTVKDGQLVCLSGQKDLGKTRLLRAILGFVPIDGGHISIDGELLTAGSAPYFRQYTAYVPQHLTLPEGALTTDQTAERLSGKRFPAGTALEDIFQPQFEGKRLCGDSIIPDIGRGPVMRVLAQMECTLEKPRDV